MIEEFVEASKHLNEALERYLSACATIHSSCVHRNWMQLDSTLRDLSDRVINELALVATYETKLRTARTTISQARNCFTTMPVTPINTLPDELLTRIFYLALSMEPCAAEDSGDELEYIRVPEYPDLLSHVCSRWRRVSTSSHALWSHIDLAPCDRLHQRLVDRAKVFANRAGDLPLYIHLVWAQHHRDCTHPCRTSERFLESVSTQIKSLELPTRDNDNPTGIDILGRCFWICKPGILTELTITDYMRPCFIWPRDNIPDHVPGGLLLRQSYELLENLWHHVTVLRLDGLFPYWTSKAYHGLVELRLTASGRGVVPISESQLVTILSSSPQLRILHLHLDTEITDQLPTNTLITPIHLGDLRVASFVFEDSEKAGRLLRWLAPGSIPLQISISISDRSPLGQFLPNSDVKDFFARCTITRFRLLRVRLLSYHTVLELLGQLPYLRVFALQYCNCRLDPRPAGSPELQPESQLEGHNALAMPGCVERFYMLFCHSSLDGLQWLVEKRLAQALTLWACNISQDRETRTASTTQVDEILKSSPGAEFIAVDKPNPSDDWD